MQYSPGLASSLFHTSVFVSATIPISAYFSIYEVPINIHLSLHLYLLFISQPFLLPSLFTFANCFRTDFDPK